MNLTVLSTSDTHGFLYPTDFKKRNQSQNFGLTKVVSEIRRIEKAADGVVLKIDNGDFLQGSPLSFYLAKNPSEGSMADIMNEVGYDCGVLGNHEFNYGIEFLEATINRLNYPIVCANILKENGDYLTGTPYVIFERNEVKIAVLGLTTPYIPHWEQPETVRGLIFKSAVATAKEFVPKLRQLADVVIVSYHGGFEKDLETGEPIEVLTGENEGYDLLHQVTGIDVLLTGHQHRYIALNDGPAPTTQPGDKGKFLAKVDLSFDESTKLIQRSHAELIEIDDQEEDKELKEKFLPLLENVETWLDQTLGTVLGDMIIKDPMEVRMFNHPYIEFIQNVQKDVSGVDVSATPLFSDEAKGFGSKIQMREIATNFVYSQALMVVEVSGEELKAALEWSASYFEYNEKDGVHISFDMSEPKVAHFNYDIYSGIDYTIDVKCAKGSRITKLKYHGKNLLPDEKIKIVMNQYRAVGGGDYHMFSPDKIVKEIKVDMAELITSYLQKNPVVEATQPTNFTLEQ
ncbi:bifunctional metallophosphatase/5'-nucleotidase [Vagococcus carniphilus]|uniref:Bifunctional UDP-sugar hydrolase/5'-nucleotidase n=1 Tax=Vagococcus carniphilus TaxID=218144 RepID=A0AAW8UC77_9ENTE|nr:bifunctional UDP-sugar hydrolase/5'-nucleotidase [Vagococcus carniphilus]MDT2814713.1 bifunctional UDP-sugar hydrolase/5'-nucleotidase [Vagococcus carniphilus]MDT2832033.1 bifunctional UDP-sugar hydrolase/5'-nucleotidase [Vagococcus carniphilus]MDT2834563.1 bifunctional UDP-sugar hydrolase/5'-nucleotidase [Vagococcus carniphilus]MDT2840826.1 bifunctional UDP-sugar hydrolase/5'-nucleotidase [Vagococcus carniphilus]MDT2855490.1 bifunctional UDP-sugar hydrolase/5'-nucleotidase [Vagococcus carn